MCVSFSMFLVLHIRMYYKIYLIIVCIKNQMHFDFPISIIHISSLNSPAHEVILYEEKPNAFYTSLGDQ